MFVRCSEFIVLESSLSTWPFCSDVLAIIESGVLKSPTVIVKLSVSPFNPFSACFVYFGVVLFGVYMFIIVISF